MMDKENIRNSFMLRFNAEPLIVRAPGRINIIGEHTDYNQGFVLPAAIDRYVYVAVSKRADGQVHLFSGSYGQWDHSILANLSRSQHAWANYVLGVVDQLLIDQRPLSGFNLFIDGDVPLGAGLSSSAAVECATVLALDQLFGLKLAKLEMAQICQRAEQVFSGVNCGIMDQYASVFGKSSHAMLLDCRALEHEYVPLTLSGHKLLLMNTNVSHSLSDSAYNTRREQCEQGVLWVKEAGHAVSSLREVDAKMLEDHVRKRDVDIYLKCLHVVHENIRTQRAAALLRTGDLFGLGRMMLATHQGLSDCYHVSCAELDFLVEAVRNADGVLGARMMGGGFGGCTLNILRESDVDAVINSTSRAYREQFGFEMTPHVVNIADGAARLC